MDRLGPYLLGPNDENQGVYTGDAKILSEAIPDESVDLIFTDPIYQNIDDYRWLAEAAKRVLKRGGSCFTWSGRIQQYEIKSVLDSFLDFQSPLFYVVVGNTYTMFSRRLFVWTTLCLWFSKGSPRNAFMPDTVVSYQRTKAAHKWNKNPESCSVWLSAFDGIVFDPFTGGGTVPAVCKMLGRHWLAFEIDPEVAETARERVRNTQPPLFVPEHQQMGMDLTEQMS